MITQFGSLFAGYPAIEDVGFAGTPVSERFYSNEHLATAFDDTLAIAQTMDRAGYDVFWLAEHHFQREGYEVIPNIPLLALHLAHHTERIKFGSAFNVPPMWHPLRLAEDFAMVDVLTGGRLIFGVGRGYHTREVETFGAPLLDGDANRELFEEQVELILKALNEPSFSHATYPSESLSSSSSLGSPSQSLSRPSQSSSAWGYTVSSVSSQSVPSAAQPSASKQRA